ncbi:dynamin family protein [Paenibacillus tarimensis]
MNTMTDSAPAVAADALLKIETRIRETGDEQHARRFLELSEKQQSGLFTAAFCGHFSAGKSTLINRLCGATLLPSSPIPTSANVVSIRNGAPCARIVRMVNGREELLEAPPDRLEEYCKNGAEFASVDISYPIPRLGEQTVLLDTPGIDSTDDAHRMATESALHLADVVFYVMDYNHVQSEINFAFAKRLKDWGKPLYLIVNQIDKHRERELSFSDYRRSVEEAFANWHLEPAGILYLSQRVPDHPNQEWPALIQLLAELAAIGGNLNRVSVDASARQLLNEHARWMDASRQDQRERWIAAAGGEDALRTVRGALSRLNQELDALNSASDRVRSELKQEVLSLLDNANIIPAATRDLAHSFLESRKPGFRTGLLFAGAKTAAEQQKRLDSFHADFLAQVDASIQWHILELFRRAAGLIGWRDHSLERQLSEHFSGIVTTDLIDRHIMPGAVFGNESTMNYCKSLAASVKGEYRQRAYALAEEISKRTSSANEKAAEEVSAKLRSLQEQAKALAMLERLDESAAAHKRELESMLPPAPVRPVLPTPSANNASQADTVSDSKQTPAADSSLDALAKLAALSAGANAAAVQERADMLGPQRQAAVILERASELLMPYEPLAAIAAAMRSKAQRLRQSRFTIALFGAFSAGKSSFANALIGESALPVSPNPTTAAINRIVPPTSDHPHRTARIVMKSKEAMLDDIRYSLALLGEDAEGSHEEDLLAKIGKLKPDALHPGGRPHYSFLKAVSQGWELSYPELGKELYVEEASYRRFVAEESRSCFVLEIDLYYDCPLTAQGIVLVDTPGADSVNARHTGVAFNYIKNADAILFVTYYNHAFSQADRQFLMQLGRVKDQFELDKMFFIVNAADLAADEEELRGVLRHVEENLLHHGIRRPRLYPVSSLSALDAKLTADDSQLLASGMEAFEQSFLSFTAGELGRLAVDSARQDLERAVQAAAAWIEATQADEASRASMLLTLDSQTDAALKEAEALRNDASFEPLVQELSELLHHVLKRILFRFGEHYNYAFNPSVLQDDGRDLKQMIWSCWLELQRLIQKELSEELLATTLRMENAMFKRLAGYYGSAAESAAAKLAGYEPGRLEQIEAMTPDLGEPWQTEAVDRKLLWGKFKHPRHFFEGEGKAELRKTLEGLLAGPLQSYADLTAERWKEQYKALWRQQVESASAKLQSDIAEYKNGRASSLRLTADPKELRELHRSLVELSEQF